MDEGDKARVLLVGSGGIGTIAALNLEAGGRASVSAVLRSSYNVVAESGFTIESIDHVLQAVPDVASHDVPPFDYIVCATKNLPGISNPSLTELLRPAVTPGHTAIILIQNGLDIELPFMAAFPKTPMLSGVSMCGSAEEKPGNIHHNCPDDLAVGVFENPRLSPDERASATALAHDFVTRYGAGGKTSCYLDADVKATRWRKLVYNATMNPVCAITGLDSGAVRLQPGLIDSIVRPAMHEVVAAAAAYDVVLTEDVVDFMIECDPIESRFEPSMLVDARKNRYIECENLLGAPIRAAKFVWSDSRKSPKGEPTNGEE
ncbi:hypothetical protein S40293_07454 [Stachybotrys chartarum IBT 40293]|nr:hypothetical protein S40293_07454 [Stachybotrys chartarum IBT 40293]